LPVFIKTGNKIILLSLLCIKGNDKLLKRQGFFGNFLWIF